MRLHLVSLLALLALTIPATAHPLLQNAMWVLFEPGRVRVAVNVSVREIAVAQNLNGADGTFTMSELSVAAGKHRDYIVKHLALFADGRPLPGAVTKVTEPPELGTPERTFFQYELEYPLGDERPARVTFAHEMLKEFPYSIGTAWDVSYTLRIKHSGSDEMTTGLLRAQQPTDFPTGWETATTQDLQPANAERWQTFREYFVHGMIHILTGYDHLLFISALVLATLNFWEMVKVIAAFTLAHTITLTLAVFDIFRLPPWVVEPVIAMSIIFVALENVLWPRRAHSWLRLGVAFGFGLIHGLGFAGGLLDAMQGLPPIGTWIALGAFSLGVEVGHQTVVLPLFGLLALGRNRLRGGFQPGAQRFGSALISVCGAYYLFVSVHEQFFSR